MPRLTSLTLIRLHRWCKVTKAVFEIITVLHCFWCVILFMAYSLIKICPPKNYICSIDIWCWLWKLHIFCFIIFKTHMKRKKKGWLQPTGAHTLLNGNWAFLNDACAELPSSRAVAAVHVLQGFPFWTSLQSLCTGYFFFQFIDGKSSSAGGGSDFCEAAERPVALSLMKWLI